MAISPWARRTPLLGSVVRSLRLLWFVLGLGLAGVLPAVADIRVEAGGGRFAPFDSDLRAGFGAAPVFSLGLAARIAETGAHVFLEASHIKESGSDRSSDPTFEADDVEYTSVPVCLGIRGDLAGSTSDSPVRLFAGVGWQSIFTHREGPFAEAERIPVHGILFEFRPAVQLTDQYRLWVAQRFSFLSNASYRAVNGTVDFSGHQLMVGLSTRID